MLRAITPTRIDHEVTEVTCVEDIINILNQEGIKDLHLQFFEGRGALKAWFIAGPKKEGELNV